MNYIEIIFGTDIYQLIIIIKKFNTIIKSGTNFFAVLINILPNLILQKNWGMKGRWLLKISGNVQGKSIDNLNVNY